MTDSPEFNEPLDPSPGEGLADSHVRLKLELGYDGSDFCGWARQPGLRSVQGVLEQALVTALRVPDLIAVCAGRTDAGVHARGQVAHVDVTAAAWNAVSHALLRRLNGLLDADVRVHSLALAAPGFDARWSALRRHYRYSVSDGDRDPLVRAWVVPNPERLDLDALNAASRELLGEHDFAAFCREREGASSVRTLMAFEWTREPGDIVVARLSADAFCHSMVRSLVGALLPVGSGRRDWTWPRSLLVAGVRASEVTVAPARGLVLEAVDYPADSLLAVQAQVTRRWRGDPDRNPNVPRGERAP